jgi:CheY-like chemotaxis protein
VALTAVLGPDQEAKCLQAGFDCYVPKPVTREKLARLLDTLHQEPIFSSMAQDASMTELIARFVHSLRETARAMHPAVAHLDTAALAALARSLRVDAGGHGFEILAEKAALLERAATEGQPPETIGALARDVQNLCRLARATSSP